MKVGIGVLGIFLAALGASPYFIGGQIESQTRGYIEKYQMPGYEIRVEVERGYRSSVLSFSYGFDPEIFALYEDADMQELLDFMSAVSYDLYVQHGPILTQNGFGFGLADADIRIDGENSDFAEQILDLLGIDAFFTAKSRVGFGGSGDLEFDMPALDYVDSDTGYHLNFSGFSGTGSFSGYGKRFSMTSASEGGQLEGENLDIVMGPISLNSSSIMDENSIYFGDYEGSLIFSSFRIDTPQVNASLSDLDIHFDMNDGDTSATSTIEYGISLANLDSETIQLRDLESAIAYENMSKDFFEQYIELVYGLNLIDEAEAETELFTFLMSEAPALLSFGPALSIPKLAFTHEGRTFDASMRVALDPENLPAYIDVTRWDMLLGSLSAQLLLDADEGLLNDIVALQATGGVDASLANMEDSEITPEMRQTMIDQQASMMVNIAESQGFLLRENGRVRTNISLQDRMLDVNGVVMPAPF